MVIGNGLLASAFKEKYGNTSAITIFAAGVSNSNETNEHEFLREKNLLLAALKNKSSKIVYFSTCSVDDPTLTNQRYTKHKLEMESLVQEAKHFALFRLSQVVGKTANPHTLTNFLFNKIKSGHSFQVWEKATRNLIDIQDVGLAVDFFLKNYEINLKLNIAAFNSVYVLKIVQLFEQILQAEAQFVLIDKGAKVEIAVDELLRHKNEIALSFSEDYIEKVIRKYYA